MLERQAPHFLNQIKHTARLTTARVNIKQHRLNVWISHGLTERGKQPLIGSEAGEGIDKAAPPHQRTMNRKNANAGTHAISFFRHIALQGLAISKGLEG